MGQLHALDEMACEVRPIGEAVSLPVIDTDHAETAWRPESHRELFCGCHAGLDVVDMPSQTTPHLAALALLNFDAPRTLFQMHHPYSSWHNLKRHEQTLRRGIGNAVQETAGGARLLL